MKIFYLIVLFYSTLFCASIDVKLYEEKEREAYHYEIKKEIEHAAIKELRPKEIIKDELIQLSRVRDAVTQKVQIEKYDLKEFDAEIITTNSFYNAINAVSNSQLKQDENGKILADIQSKLLFLKQSIERITEEEKPKLLSFQLQFAYYKIQQKNIELKTTLLKEDEKNIKDTLLNSLNKLKCEDEKIFKTKLSDIEKTIEENKKNKIAKELQKERAVIEESETVDAISKKIELLNLDYQEDIGKKIVLNMINALCFLKEKQSTDFYKLISEIQDSVKDISDNTKKDLFLKQIVIIKDISKAELGQAKLFFGATIEESKALVMQAKEFLLSPLFIFNERPISLFSLFKALLYIIFGFILGVMYKRWIAKISYKWKDISMMSIRLASNIGYYLIILVFFIIAISSLGIDMSSVSLIAGALSIGIGFGLQTVVSNLIAGIILMLERTIRIGDTIEISDLVVGTVTDMRIRSTTIKTFDNIDIVVPNSSFIQNNVVNWTLDDRIRRMRIPFSVAYGTEVEDVKRAVITALEESTLAYIRNDDERKPDIKMTLMNSSSVDFELFVWVEWNIKLKNIPFKSDFLIVIYNALRANNINIPFPQLDVYIKQMIDETKTAGDA